MDPFIDVQKTIDNVATLLERVAEVAATDVLVGIPGAKATRRDDPTGKPQPTNVELAYIHEFGSPLQRIPARPFLFPGVAKVRPTVLPMFKEAGRAAMEGKPFKPIFNRIGMLARNAVVEEITDPEPPFVPLKPATIRARLMRTAAGRRKLKKIMQDPKYGHLSGAQRLSYWAQEIDPQSGSANIHPLIDTGQLRASINYVVVTQPTYNTQALRTAGIEVSKRS